MTPVKTVICMKWGTRYSAEFPNKLYSSVRRNLTGDMRFVCFTDDAGGLDPAIEIQPLPEISLPERVRWYPWRKIALWQKGLANMSGDVLFLDLDLIVTGSLDDLFSYNPDEFCIAENWTQPGEGIGNTSVYRFPADGRYAYIYDQFMKDPDKYVSQHKISQRYVSACIPEKIYWPQDWIVSFKHTLLPKFPLNWVKTPELPQDTRAVAFTGRPDPDEAEIGKWLEKKRYKRIYKHVRPTPWITKHWR